MKYNSNVIRNTKTFYKMSANDITIAVGDGMFLGMQDFDFVQV